MHAAKSFYIIYFGHSGVVSLFPFIVNSNNNRSRACMPLENNILNNTLPLVVLVCPFLVNNKRSITDMHAAYAGVSGVSVR